MTPLHCHQILKILLHQVNFAPVYPKKGRHYDHWYHVFWKLLYRFDIIFTKISVALAHAFKATQMDRHSQIQEYAVFVHSTLNIVHDVAHFIHLHTEFAKIIFDVATSFS